MNAQARMKTAPSKRLIKKNYIYHGLGFPVELESVEVEVIDGEEYYNIDILNLKFSMLIVLMIDPSIKLLGGMIKFVRQSLELSMEEMANKLGVVKSTIQKWEEKSDKIIELTDFQIFKVKQEIKNYLDRIIEFKIEKVLDDKVKKESKKAQKPMRVPLNIPLSELFNSKIAVV